MFKRQEIEGINSQHQFEYVEVLPQKVFKLGVKTKGRKKAAVKDFLLPQLKTARVNQQQLHNKQLALEQSGFYDLHG